MGQNPSHATPSTSTVDKKPKGKKKVLKLFKIFAKSGALQRRKANPARGQDKQKGNIQPCFPICRTKDVINQGTSLMMMRPVDSSSHSQQSKKSIRSSRSIIHRCRISLCSFTSAKSKQKFMDGHNAESVNSNNKGKLTFNKRKGKPSAKQNDKPPFVDSTVNNCSSTDKVNYILDENNNRLSVKTEIKMLLTPSNTINKGRSTEEIYCENLQKFERILVLTATTSEDGSDCFDENNNYLRGKVKPTSSKPPREIRTSRNQIDLDPSFINLLIKKASWISSVDGETCNSESERNLREGKVTFGQSYIVNKLFPARSKTKKNASKNSSKPRVDKNNNKISEKKENPEKPIKKMEAPREKNLGDDKIAPPKTIRSPATDTETNSPKSTKNAKSKESKSNAKKAAKSSASRSKSPRQPKSVKTSSPRKKSSKSPKGSKKRKRERKQMQNIKRGMCAGKGCGPTAPPVYLDYGLGSNKAAMLRKQRNKDLVMERLKNVDVVEELTYVVPNADEDGICGDDEDENCDYFAVCESCGEMEPVPDALKKKIKCNKDKSKCDSTPVTYCRRQRFNFKNKNDEDDDGPPYPYEGLQCPGQCRCSCCIAGLRRSPHCKCKCCQTKGNARRCNSFDEMVVGVNPVIRRIRCPEEECALAEKEYKKLVPEESGMYKFEKEGHHQFERQVPRTPTPIVIPVPVPRPLNKHELKGIAEEALAIKCANRPPPEPMYLPPIFGQCNPGYPPCCAPKGEINKKDTGSKSTTAQSESGTASKGTGSTASK